MMSMLNKTPIDYLTWGNHEHDLDHADVMKREKEYEGVWVNSNMQSHESFKDSTSQVKFSFQGAIIKTSVETFSKEHIHMMSAQGA